MYYFMYDIKDGVSIVFKFILFLYVYLTLHKINRYNSSKNTLPYSARCWVVKDDK